ncbi:MAG: radical SAM protein, partial [Pirellulales bacterium]|nr:radical SAM protein [Pirellulales bacterium]
MSHSSHPDHPLHESHPRSFEANRYVYPVLSRRAEGISIGVNLNADKVCNFNCIYCQVDRVGPAEMERVNPKRLAEELEWMV